MPDPYDPHDDLAGALHDVSNALTVLLGWLEEARAPDAPASQVAYALSVVEERARIARDLARRAIRRRGQGAAEGIEPRGERRPIAPLVDEVTRTLAVQASHARVRLAVTPDVDASAGIVASATDFAQVLTNLILNAIAHARQGVEVEVALGSDACVVLVTDDGPGVPLASREAIFEGHSTRPGGTGVGLRHARALARAAGGDVELDPPPSSDAVGARFRLTWPRADAVPRAPLSTARFAELLGLRVLVVEDDAAVHQLITAGLEARGAEVTLAETRADLDRALERGAYDVALVDLSPIERDPSEAIARLRERSPNAHLVLVTGGVDSVPETLLAEAGDLVRKPFEVRELVAAIVRHTTRTGLRAGARDEKRDP